ncbi:MAG: hypothetical protein WD599_07275 [Balneolaceae bacterium]
MQRFRFLIYTVVLLTVLLTVRNARAQFSDGLQVRGYLQAMPVWMKAELPPPVGSRSFWEYRLQNRLNLRWDLSADWTFNWQMRTRFFAGDLVRDLPFYADAIHESAEDGLVNLSRMVAERDSWLLHYNTDRLNLEWATTDWSVRIGRQRINWGINMVSNPNDLFNIYSFYDFDYPERPRSDAIRIQRFTGPFSRWEVAVRPDRTLEQTVAAFLYAFNTDGYDVQVLGGYYRNRLAIGGGWAGSLSRTGFKGEVMFFSDLEENGGARESNIVTAVSADHMFDNSLFLVVEALYNQKGGRGQFVLTGDPPAADNPSFSRFQLTANGTYPFSPIFSGSLAMIYYPDEQAVFISPAVRWSVLQDLDMNVFTQLFAGSEESVFQHAGNVVATSLKWNF